MEDRIVIAPLSKWHSKIIHFQVLEIPHSDRVNNTAVSGAAAARFAPVTCNLYHFLLPVGSTGKLREHME